MAGLGDAGGASYGRILESPNDDSCKGFGRKDSKLAQDVPILAREVSNPGREFLSQVEF
jgi:hypothetical protein